MGAVNDTIAANEAYAARFAAGAMPATPQLAVVTWPSAASRCGRTLSLGAMAWMAHSKQSKTLEPCRSWIERRVIA